MLLTAGFTPYMNANPLPGPMVSLPLEALELVPGRRARLHQPGLRVRRVPASGGHRPVRGGPRSVGGAGHVRARGQRRVVEAGARRWTGSAARVPDRRRRHVPTATTEPSPEAGSWGGPPAQRGAAVRLTTGRTAGGAGAAAPMVFAVLSAFDRRSVSAGRAPPATCRSPARDPRGRPTPSTSGSPTSSSTACGSSTPANGSTAGRQDYIAARPTSPPPTSPSRPIPPTDRRRRSRRPTATPTCRSPPVAPSFMYNLKIDGQQVTNLRLSGANIAKIFTGRSPTGTTRPWPPTIPGSPCPTSPIVPVVRSDGAGVSSRSRRG